MSCESGDFDVCGKYRLRSSLRIRGAWSEGETVLFSVKDGFIDLSSNSVYLRSDVRQFVSTISVSLIKVNQMMWLSARTDRAYCVLVCVRQNERHSIDTLVADRLTG